MKLLGLLLNGADHVVLRALLSELYVEAQVHEVGLMELVVQLMAHVGVAMDVLVQDAEDVMVVLEQLLVD